MQDKSSASFQLVLGTGAFALCFAVFGSMSAMMPIISKHMALTPVQKSIAIAIPVLLGSLGRIPLGILTDRFGGRIVFSLVMLFSITPAFLMGGVSNYSQLVTYGFFIGVALAIRRFTGPWLNLRLISTSTFTWKTTFCSPVRSRWSRAGDSRCKECNAT